MNNILGSLRKNRTLVIILVIMVAFFLLAVQGMSTKDWVITLLRSLSVGAVTFLVASGFSIILGLMDVLNLAHGVLFMVGAYVGWSVYVRPDTFIDLLTPVALLVSGFLLMPVWERLIDRASLKGTVKACMALDGPGFSGCTADIYSATGPAFDLGCRRF